MSSERVLPDFDDPPVIETSLGVEFSPLDKWSIPHFGLFWKEIQGSYPRFEVQPAIGPQIERFGDELKQRTMPEVEFLVQPPVRCWFIHESETRLIQIQNDRFVHNWRKIRGTDVYPHYESTRPTFEREWSRFCSFLESQRISRPEVRQCEVSYFNHIERGKGWQSLADLPDILSCWTGKLSTGFLPPPEAVLLDARYLIPDNQGRLHIILQPAIRHADAKEVLQLTLIARGRPASSTVSDKIGRASCRERV